MNVYIFPHEQMQLLFSAGIWCTSADGYRDAFTVFIMSYRRQMSAWSLPNKLILKKMQMDGTCSFFSKESSHNMIYLSEMLYDVFAVSVVVVGLQGL